MGINACPCDPPIAAYCHLHRTDCSPDVVIMEVSCQVARTGLPRSSDRAPVNTAPTLGVVSHLSAESSFGMSLADVVMRIPVISTDGGLFGVQQNRQ